MGACTSDDSLLNTVTEIAPHCFLACPKFCKTVGALIDVYIDFEEVSATEAKACELQSSFECVFKPVHIELCRPLLNQVRGYGINVPMDQQGLEKKCGSTSRSGPKFYDVLEQNKSSNDSASADD